MPEKDKVFLDTFGLGYNEKGERVITVFLRYLTGLSPQHQQIWNTHVIEDKCYLEPDYYRNTIEGKWAKSVSIYDALCEELYQINEMVKLIGKPELFKEDFKSKRPEDLKIFLKPTLKNYNDFILTLDKMLSENINKKFFKGEIELTEEIKRKDGKIEVINKGTIRLLEEWLRSKFRDDGRYLISFLGQLSKLERKDKNQPIESMRMLMINHSIINRMN